jgi:DNA-binding NtrC family response regulator
MTMLKIESQSANQGSTLEALVGESEWMEHLRSIIQAVAAYSSSVLITGPSGTGKESIARAIHQLSPRAAWRFIPVDCASIAGPLFASHMFGQLKSYYTGAGQNAMGCFRAADGGTIFFDEIGELDLDLQAKLLRVLQERMVMPVGSHDGEVVDVRVIAASNRDLQGEVSAGRFREDLYFRLNVVSIETCPLRERGDDVVVLAEHILRRLATENGMPLKRLSEAAGRQLRSYDWPGNIRELENALERAVLFSPSDIIDDRTLPCAPTGNEATQDDEVATIAFESAAAKLLQGHATADGRWLTAAEVERDHIIRTLEMTRHNQSAAAKLLDIDRHQLRRRMQEYSLLAPGLSRRGRPPSTVAGTRKAA